MKKYTIALIIVGMVFGIFAGAAIEKNYLIKTARLEKLGGASYCIAYGLGECYEVHEYRL